MCSNPGWKDQKYNKLVFHLTSFTIQSYHFADSYHTTRGARQRRIIPRKAASSNNPSGVSGFQRLVRSLTWRLSSSIWSLFTKVKDPLPKMELADVVYLTPCRCDMVRYMLGEHRGTWKHRLKNTRMHVIRGTRRSLPLWSISGISNTKWNGKTLGCRNLNTSNLFSKRGSEI